MIIFLLILNAYHLLFVEIGIPIFHPRWLFFSFLQLWSSRTLEFFSLFPHFFSWHSSAHEMDLQNPWPFSHLWSPPPATIDVVSPPSRAHPNPNFWKQTAIVAFYTQYHTFYGIFSCSTYRVSEMFECQAKNGVFKYTGMWQSMLLVAREEGRRGLYAGMGTHVARVVSLFLLLRILAIIFSRTGFWVGRRGEDDVQEFFSKRKVSVWVLLVIFCIVNFWELSFEICKRCNYQIGEK